MYDGPERPKNTKEKRGERQNKKTKQKDKVKLKEKIVEIQNIRIIIPTLNQFFKVLPKMACYRYMLKEDNG